jgi:hypothetical protein
MVSYTVRDRFRFDTESNFLINWHAKVTAITAGTMTRMSVRIMVSHDQPVNN